MRSNGPNGRSVDAFFLSRRHADQAFLPRSAAIDRGLERHLFGYARLAIAELDDAGLEPLGSDHDQLRHADQLHRGASSAAQVDHSHLERRDASGQMMPPRRGWPR
jgi:hypothetical protein